MNIVSGELVQMALTREQAEWLQDLFSGIPGVSVRRMFGGAGVFREGLMFALSLDDGRVALKADEQTIPDFKAEGSTQWTYPHRSGKQMEMGYWHAPERLFDDPDEFRDWAEKAFMTALRIDARKPKSQRKHIAGY
jgi:DNA transformation protein